MSEPTPTPFEARRRELDLTQAEVARVARVTQQSVSRIERGLRTPRLDIAYRLAAAVQSTPAEMFPHAVGAVAS